MDPCSDVDDDALLESVLSLSLEEAAYRGERLEGKSRVGASLTTEQYALQLQEAELESALQSIRDARLARNLEHAVDDDDARQRVQLEQQVWLENHENNHADAMESVGSTSPFDVDIDHVQLVDSPDRQMPELVPEHEM